MFETTRFVANVKNIVYSCKKTQRFSVDSPRFSAYQVAKVKRIEFLEKSTEEFSNVEIDHFEGLTVDYCLKKDAQYILRGLRNPADFEFEKAIAHTNRTLAHKKLETVFLLTSSGKSFISSSIVREIITHKGEYELLVPAAVRV